MPGNSTPSANDPVSRAVHSHFLSTARIPVPLVATTYDIAIRSGLADVATSRRFINAETGPIEATLTFPLPVHAVLHALEARIGDRVVTAVAQGRSRARETYEDAIDRGKTTALHEELLPGVHMLSLGPVAPGAEITVTARFAVALSLIGDRAVLRIPTTVGDVYGDSGLADADEMIHGGQSQAAEVSVTCDSGVPVLVGGALVDGKSRVALDVPIVVEVGAWTATTLHGRAADGTGVSLDFAAAARTERPIAASVLVDNSGSMNELCEHRAGLTKHAAVLLGLAEAGAGLVDGDRLQLWEFNSWPRHVGTAERKQWRTLIRQLTQPTGGTEIGGALAALLDEDAPGDVLLVTDGKTHALDVHALARRGARFTVVLIGEDSLEANVGHLADLTGGAILVPAGVDVATAIVAAIDALRAPRPTVHRTGGATPAGVEVTRAGMTIRATWTAAAEGARDDRFDRAVGAYVAALRLRDLDESEAQRLAEAEGLVTHLTSLVLVDEAGAVQPGLPATRKIALPSPATQVLAMSSAAARMPTLACAAIPVVAPRSRATCAEAAQRPATPGTNSHVQFSVALDAAIGSRSTGPDRSVKRRIREAEREERDAAPAGTPAAAPRHEDRSRTAPLHGLEALAGRIDWRAEVTRLIEGDLSGLPPVIADAIDRAAEQRVVQRAAESLGLSARKFVIGLLARAAAGGDRHAARIARQLFGRAGKREVRRVSQHLGFGA